jgi:hypothetical protein
MFLGKIVLGCMSLEHGECQTCWFFLWQLYIRWYIVHCYSSVRNIPLQVNADDGSMEVDIPQGEQPKTNEQTDSVVR